MKIIYLLFLTSASIFLTFFSKAQVVDSTMNESQKKIYVTLLNFRKPGKNYAKYDLYNFPKKEFGHPLIKKRLLELLTPTLNEEEKEAYRADFRESYKENIETRTKQALVKDTSLSYIQVYDSIQKRRFEALLQSTTKDLMVSPEIIHLVGYLDMKEAIPYLLIILDDPKYYEKEKVRLALARLLVEPYYSEMLKKYSDWEFINKQFDVSMDCELKTKSLLYIGTQDSFYALSNWLYRDEKYFLYSEGDEKASIAAYMVYSIYSILSDETENYGFVDHFDEMTIQKTKISSEDIEFAKEWFKVNKGRLIFPRDILYF